MTKLDRVEYMNRTSHYWANAEWGNLTEYPNVATVRAMLQHFHIDSQYKRTEEYDEYSESVMVTEEIITDKLHFYWVSNRHYEEFDCFYERRSLHEQWELDHPNWDFNF